MMGSLETESLSARSLRGSIKSCPTRTLDNYPMRYSRADLDRSVSLRRSTRMAARDSHSGLLRDSRNLRDYSKKMFDYAMANPHHVVSNSRPTGTVNRTSYLPVSCEIYELSSKIRSKRSNSGPTLNGSPAYNRIPLLLNGIRNRNFKEPSLTVIKNSRPAWDDIYNHIKKANERYFVIKSMENDDLGSEHSLCHATGFRDFLLMPINKDFPTVDTGAETEQEIEAEMDKMTSQMIQELEEHIIPSVTVEVAGDGTDITSSSLTKEANQNIPTIVTVADEETRTSAEPGGPARRQEREGDSRPSRPQSTNSKPGSGLRLTSGRARSSRRRPASTSGARCWVDDATVSSDGSPKANDEDNLNKVKDTGGGLLAVPGKKRGRSRAGSRRGGSVRSNRSAKSKDATSGTPEKKKEEPTDVSTPKDDASRVPSTPTKMPDFVCPSSEDKSRQVAVQQWLSQVTFTAADRSIPLMS